jgi:outer membrane protein
MRSTLRAAFVALGLVAPLGLAQAQNGGATKIGYVNSEALMSAAPGRAAADSALTKMGEGFRAQLSKLEEDARKMLSDYQKNEPKMTAAAKEKAQKDLQALETELQTKQQSFSQQIQARQQELIAPIIDVVKKVIDDIRVEGGYAIILDNAQSQGGSPIVAADKNLDLTEKTISRLRATPAPKPVAAEPTKGAPSAPAGVTRPPARPPTQ